MLKRVKKSLFSILTLVLIATGMYVPAHHHCQ
jgi:hypothetical protein